MVINTKDVNQGFEKTEVPNKIPRQYSQQDFCEEEIKKPDAVETQPLNFEASKQSSAAPIPENYSKILVNQCPPKLHSNYCIRQTNDFKPMSDAPIEIPTCLEQENSHKFIRRLEDTPTETQNDRDFTSNGKPGLDKRDAKSLLFESLAQSISSHEMDLNMESSFLYFMSFKCKKCNKFEYLQMSNLNKCPCDCPASILDKQNFENYERLTKNRECTSADQNDEKCEHYTNDNECENHHNNDNITHDNECKSYNQNDQTDKHDHNVCIAQKQTDQNLNKKCSKTEHGASCNNYVSNKQTRETPKIETDYQECLNKLKEYEQKLKTDKNVSRTESGISQTEDQKLTHENEKCLKVLKKNISQMYALSDQNCLKEKKSSGREKPETKDESQIRCIEDKFKIQYNLSPLTLPNIKCDDQDKLKVNTDLSPLTMPNIKCNDQEKGKLLKQPITPPKSSSNNLKKCIDQVCSRICNKFKDIEKSFTADKDKNNLSASSRLSSNSSADTDKNSKSSFRCKSSNLDRSSKSTNSVPRKSPEPSEIVIISRAQQKFYEFEKKPSKACSSKGSSKSIKGKNSDCNSNCTCSKKSWW